VLQIINIATTSKELILQTACQVLAAGGLLIFPTETTYGAGVDATNPVAVEKLLAYKSRREGKPLSIAVTDQYMAQLYVEVNEQAQQLYKQFLPGPVTVVSHGKHTVAPGVESEFGTLGVRIPAHALILDLIKKYGKPITATSGNGSGQKRPYAIEDIFSTISDKQKSLIDLVLDAGTLPPNPPSTVIDTTLSTPLVMRQGDLNITNTDSQATQLETYSEAETKALAGKLVLKHWNVVKESGFIFGLNGPLGAGKTVFAKGVADFLQITETLTSPTYSYIEEYEYLRHGVSGKLYHLDMWKVSSAEEFERLEIKQLLQPHSVLIIEWWSQIKPLWKYQDLPVIEVDIADKQSHRTFTVTDSQTTRNTLP